MVAAIALALVSHWVAPIDLTVDAREIGRGLFHVSERFQAKAGKLVLWYPNWNPGGHMPGGPLNSVIAFRILADGRTLSWKRDLTDMFQITTSVPPRARQVQIDFTRADSSGTAHLARVKWNALIWYPAGPTDNLVVHPRLLLPDRWKAASALPIESEGSSQVRYSAASLTTLGDSPVEIGRYYKRFDVSGRSTVKHFVDMMADSEQALGLSQAMLDHVKRIHEEMETVTGTRHYHSYHWLLTVSDFGGYAGLEHHESSEDGTDLNALSVAAPDLGDLLSHEYFHSYNGKFMRPIGLCTPDYQRPMKDDLLWVYEGLTEFAAHVLSCRTGWWTQQQWRDQMALLYAEMNSNQGRKWRPLEDTAEGWPALAVGGNITWPSARRTEDFYSEMAIVWLEVDMRIRELSRGRKSIMNFLRRFLGGPANGPELKPYTFNTIVAALNATAPYDWAKLLNSRIYQLQPELSPLGFTLAGWKVVYSDQPNSMAGMLHHRARKGLFLPTSLGMSLRTDGTITDVIPGSPSDEAGLAPEMKILTINGVAYAEDRLLEATKKGGSIELSVRYKDEDRIVRLRYAGGLKIPHLERIKGRPDLLAGLLRPSS